MNESGKEGGVYSLENQLNSYYTESFLDKSPACPIAKRKMMQALDIKRNVERKILQQVIGYISAAASIGVAGLCML